MRLSLSHANALTLADGGSLAALLKKGNLTHVETLYNPNNCFAEVHIVVFDKRDLAVSLSNPTLKVHYIPYLPFGKIGWMLSLPFLLFKMNRLIRKNKIKVIRARNAYFAGLLGVLAGKLAGIPIVISLGGDNRLAQKLLGYYYGGSRLLSFYLEEFSLRRANLVFCVNEFTRQYAIRLGVMPAKTRIVPHRLDIEVSKYDGDSALVRSELGFDNTPTITMIGRLERDKQMEVIVEAAFLIAQKFPQIKFVFVGDGRQRIQLELRAQELGLNKMVKFVGFQPREQVIKYLKAATIVCIPMSGFVIYEAAAAKKPIVAFDVEWHSEFIQHEKTGMLIKNRDIEKLTEAIIKLLDNPKFAQQLATNAHQQFCEQFDQKSIIEKEIKAYQELVSII